MFQEPEWDVSSAFVAKAASQIKLKTLKTRATQISRENKENEARSSQVHAHSIRSSSFWSLQTSINYGKSNFPEYFTDLSDVETSEISAAYTVLTKLLWLQVETTEKMKRRGESLTGYLFILYIENVNNQCKWYITLFQYIQLLTFHILCKVHTSFIFF